MIVKSALKKSIDEKCEEHEIEDQAFADDLLDTLVRDFGEEIYDDDDEDQDGPLALGEGD
jgi:hypothetical protein